MEYKYRMLQPAPFSTESIDFKLSDTFIDHHHTRSPIKAQDSLTYTVSMEIINDSESSPCKNYQQYFHFPESLVSVENIPSFGEEQKTGPFDLASPNHIVSIRIQPDSPMSSQINSNEYPEEHKEAILIDICGEQNQVKANSMFGKKVALKGKNMELEAIPEEQGIAQEIRMGKVMSRIHSQLKEGKTVLRSKTFSNKERSPSAKQQRNRGESAKKIESQQPVNIKAQEMLKQLNWSSLEEGKGISSIKCNGSSLTKTNCSSDVNCSPQLNRRKSDYIYQKNVKEDKQTSPFSSQRSNDMKIFHTYKANSKSTTRNRIYSLMMAGKCLQNREKAKSLSDRLNIVQNKQMRQRQMESVTKRKINIQNCEISENINNNLIKHIQIVGLKAIRAQKENMERKGIKIEMVVKDKSNAIEEVEVEINTDIIMEGMKRKKWRNINPKKFKVE